MKNFLERLNSSLNWQMKESKSLKIYFICECLSKEQKERVKEKEKSEEPQRNVGYHQVIGTRMKGERKKQEKIIELIMALMKNINLHIQEAQPTPERP